MEIRLHDHGVVFNSPIIFDSGGGNLGGCIQKFPDWPPGARTVNGTALFTRCSCNAILSVSPVSFAAITLCVASQRVFIAVSVYFSLSTQSGNFWIHPPRLINLELRRKRSMTLRHSVCGIIGETKPNGPGLKDLCFFI
jgi:hypothetical protein